MSGKNRPYIFYDSAISVCSTCLRRVEGKIIIEDDCVYMDKICVRHGREKVLLADDAEYYRRCRENFFKPSEMPEKWNTPIKYGCPYDCGLCPSHEQHSCLTLIEVTDGCNLRCPICYADSGPERVDEFRTLEHIIQMLDAVVANEGEPDVVQISGGEPTIHPDFWAIMDAAKERPIQHLMLNTNGVRIANDPGFAARLADYMPGFEVYLQFDSLRKEPLLELRGADLREVRRKALQALNDNGVSTTLVVTLKKGLNDDEVGAIISFAATHDCIRGVTFQPIQEAGRAEGYDPSRDRLTLSEVRRIIAEQSPDFSLEDILPVPCHPDSIAMAYALKLEGGLVPISGLVDDETLRTGTRNTIQLEHDPAIREALFNALSTGHSPASAADSLAQLLCCLPGVEAPLDLGYQNVFRVIIMDFIDAQSFDLRSVKKTCVHIVAPDLRIIPFDTFNMFYRGDLEEQVLKPLRAELEAAGLALMGPAQNQRLESVELPMLDRKAAE